jgi:TatD DNase family protein
MFYETHAHLDFPDFASDVAEVIERARQAGITKIITVGTDLDGSRRAVELANRFPEVYAAVGWHPCHASEAPADIRSSLRALAAHPKVVAIGETGLDFSRLPSKSGGGAADDRQVQAKQASIFQQQLEIARELGLNCIIHQRDAFDTVLTEMEPYRDRVRGVFHCFVNDVASMQRVLSVGSLVSFTGILTFKSATTVRDTVAATPLGQFMLETDSPYLAPVPYRGKRCEPAYVREIAEAVAAIKHCTVEELSAATCAAASAFFPPLAAARADKT